MRKPYHHGHLREALLEAARARLAACPVFTTDPEHRANAASASSRTPPHP